MVQDIVIDQLNSCVTGISNLFFPLVLADLGVIAMVIISCRKLFERRQVVAYYFELLRYQRYMESELASLEVL